VPVFFVFDAKPMLTREAARFSNGNLASPGAQLGKTATFFRNPPWDAIYHDEALRDPITKSSIIFHRNAEIVFPDAVDLDDLREVVCRSGPEMDSLLFGLGSSRPRWQDMIRVRRRDERLFFWEWTYIESVAPLENELVLTPASVQGDAPC
jgi:hypothetical protein